MRDVQDWIPIGNATCKSTPHKIVLNTEQFRDNVQFPWLFRYGSPDTSPKSDVVEFYLRGFEVEFPKSNDSKTIVIRQHLLHDNPIISEWNHKQKRFIHKVDKEDKYR